MHLYEPYRNFTALWLDCTETPDTMRTYLLLRMARDTETHHLQKIFELGWAEEEEEH